MGVATYICDDCSPLQNALSRVFLFIKVALSSGVRSDFLGRTLTIVVA
jgi:hypothetical protein